MTHSGGIGLVVVLKDEVHDVAAWLAWHMALGFDTIFVFDDGSTDGTDQLVRSAAELHDIRYLKVVQDCDHFYDRQQNEYKKILAASREAFAWLCFLDADEYLLLNRDDTVRDFLARYPDAHGVAVNWCLYGGGGNLLRPLVPPPVAYPMHSDVEETINRHVKSFVRPDRLHAEDGGMHNVHCFRVDARNYLNTDGQPVPWSATPGIVDGLPLWDTALIMHFQSRSVEHFLDRARKRRDVTIDIRTWINESWNRQATNAPGRFFGGMFEILTRMELRHSRQLCERIADLDLERQPASDRSDPVPRLFLVQTHFGTILQVDVETGLLVHAAPDDGGRGRLQPVFLAAAEGLPDVLLIRPGETRQPLRIDGYRQAVTVVPLQRATSAPDQVTLQTETTRLFLTAELPGQEGTGKTCVKTRKAREWEAFRLIEADPTGLDPSVGRMLSACFRVQSGELTVEFLADWLSSYPASDVAPLLQILLRRLPKAEWLRLSWLLSASVASEILGGSQYS